jgi:hypothetical protein
VVAASSATASSTVASLKQLRSSVGSMSAVAGSPPPLLLPLASLYRQSVGLGLARPVGCGVLFELARHEKRPDRPCLGRQPGTKPSSARPGRHGMSSQPDPIGPCLGRARAVLGRAGPLAMTKYN